MIVIDISVGPQVSMDYVRQLIENTPELYDRLLGVLEEIAYQIAEMAKDTCPVKTGRLRDSIVVEVEENGVAIKATVDYALFQEFGTKYIPGQYFMTNAYDSYVPLIESRIYEEIYDYFKGVTG